MPFPEGPGPGTQVVGFQVPKSPRHQNSPKALYSMVFGPKALICGIHTLNGFWTLKPYLFGYLDPEGLCHSQRTSYLSSTACLLLASEQGRGATACTLRVCLKDAETLF